MSSELPLADGGIVYDPRGAVTAGPRELAARLETLDGCGSACSTTRSGTRRSCCATS